MLYLWLNIAIFGTIFLSFDKKVAYYTYFPFLLKAIGVILIVFIPWDSLFSYKKIWGFDSDYLMGIEFLYLPLEEWLFFITVPFSCTFIHLVLKAYFRNPFEHSKKLNTFYMLLSLLLIALALYNFKQLYTASTFLLSGIVLFFLNYLRPKFMLQFTFTYLVALIPFFIVNSILTGSFTEKPIVWYNNDHIFGLRIGTIPFEDLFYNLLLLLLSTFITESLYSKKHKML